MTTQPTPTRSPEVLGVAASQARECLSFRLGQENYGIDILAVQELRGYEPPTRIAGAPGAVLGVLNLRGVIVPVVDLRLHLGVEPRFDALTVTVVLNVGGSTIGAVVDSVADVVALPAAQIRPAPEFSGLFDAQCINGIGCTRQGDDELLLLLLDVEQLMASPELGLANLVTH